MTNHQVRQALHQNLPIDEVFDSFLVCYFPDIYRNIARGMSRIEKENYLFSQIDCEIINERLEDFLSLQTDEPSFIGYIDKLQYGSTFRWFVSRIYVAFRRVLFVDSFLLLINATLEWIADMLGISRDRLEKYRPFRSAFIVLLFIVIIISLLQRCSSEATTVARVIPCTEYTRHSLSVELATRLDGQSPLVARPGWP